MARRCAAIWAIASLAPSSDVVSARRAKGSQPRRCSVPNLTGDVEPQLSATQLGCNLGLPRRANALSALYRQDGEQKRLLDGMLLAAPR
jgi:hypothetical protein